MNNTETDLQQVSTGEARTRLKYTAFAMQTMQEGHPEIAQLFLKATGAETIHGISYLQVAGGITTTLAHRDEAANGEDDEIEEMYPRFIREAGGAGRADAAASFRLALEREKHHRVMFKDAACKQEAARSKTRLIAISRRNRCNIPAAANDR